MKKIILTSVAALLLPMAAMAQSSTGGTSSGIAATANSTTASSTSQGSSLSAQDQKFIKTAAASGLSEVQEGQLAQSKGDSAVQAVGARMVADHTKANEQLASIASAKGVTPPAAPTSHEARELAHLQGLSGASFDSAYLKDQRRAHEKAISLFETEASSGSDPDLKNFASNTLPILKMHLKMIETAK